MGARARRRKRVDLWPSDPRGRVLRRPGARGRAGRSDRNRSVRRNPRCRSRDTGPTRGKPSSRGPCPATSSNDTEPAARGALPTHGVLVGRRCRRSRLVVGADGRGATARRLGTSSARAAVRLRGLAASTLRRRRSGPWRLRHPCSRSPQGLWSAGVEGGDRSAVRRCAGRSLDRPRFWRSRAGDPRQPGFGRLGERRDSLDPGPDQSEPRPVLRGGVSPSPHPPPVSHWRPTSRLRRKQRCVLAAGGR